MRQKTREIMALPRLFRARLDATYRSTLLDEDGA
jgi:hypothetical protein